MKKTIFQIFIAAAFMIIATACPVGIEHAPGNPGTVKIDKRLIGTWTTEDAEAAMQKIIVKKQDDNTYSINIVEKSDNFLADATQYSGWLTTIDGQQFIYSKPDTEDKYYTYHLKFNSNTQFTISDIGLLDKGVDGVTSTETFRSEISRSLKKKDFLSEPVIYNRQK